MPVAEIAAAVTGIRSARNGEGDGSSMTPGQDDTACVQAKLVLNESDPPRALVHDPISTKPQRISIRRLDSEREW
jgi:hypothetical protein